MVQRVYRTWCGGDWREWHRFLESERTVTEREAWIERRSKGERGRGTEGGRETVAVCRRRERRRQLSNPIFFPQISSTTHKKSQRSSKNKSGSDPSDSRLKIRLFEKYIKFQWSSKSVSKLAWIIWSKFISFYFPHQVSSTSSLYQI